MEPLDADLHSIWEPIRELEQQVKRGQPLQLTATVRDLLRRAAPTVAMSGAEAEAALASVESATSLLLEIRQRMRDSSRWFINAMHEMSRLRDSGDLEGARQQMYEVLAVERVPFYREIAEGELEKLK